MRSQIPLSGGLGSSAAAIVAGLLAAQRLAGGVAGSAELLELATSSRATPTTSPRRCSAGSSFAPTARLTASEPPAALEALLVVPERAVRTQRARAVLPASVPLADAVYNTAHGALLMLGLGKRRPRAHPPRPG